ncbi:hypothetical protein Tco_0776667 [Tanacetum coccineum]
MDDPNIIMEEYIRLEEEKARKRGKEMVEYSQKWHNRTSSRTKSTETSDGLAAIQAQLNNLGREIKRVNKKVYAAQMSKVLQEKVFGSLPSSTETNPRDQVKSISTAKADFFEIRRIRHDPYAREVQDVKILDTYDQSLPQKEKDPGSFTLPFFIHNICFDKALVDLGASGDESFDPIYGCYIELNDLDTPLETKMDRDDFVPIFVKTGSYKMEFSCVIRDKDEGKSHAETLIDITIFVGSFSIILGFTIIDDDDMTKDVVLDMKFCKKYASCQRIMKRFAFGNICERIIEDE